MNDPRRRDHQEGMGCGTKFLIGIFIVAAMAMIGLIGLAFLVPYLIDRGVEAYTDAAPVAMDAVPLPPEEREAIDARVEEFREAIDEGEYTRPLVLTEEEINGVLAEEVDKQDGQVQLAFLPGEVKAYVSLPIKRELPLGPWSRDLTGRYLNGVATVALGIVDGKLDFSIREFDVKGRKLPAYALDAIEGQVEQSGALDDEEVRSYIERTAELRVEQGRIVLTPRQ
jgi:hypothetical protein